METLQYTGAHYGGGKVLPSAAGLAEAHANGGVPVQTWVATPWFNGRPWEQFFSKNLFLLMLPEG